jgi:ribosomal protein S18 acetylase RimI-like enzyme
MIDELISGVQTLPITAATPFIIRPLDEDDRDALLTFGMSLPPDDVLYLEDDFQNPDIIMRLVNARFAENWRQIIAVAGDRIIGYSAVRRLPGWSQHVTDIVLIVAEDWRRAGVGTALAQAIFQAARDLGAEKVVVEMVEEQYAGQGIFQRLGFSVEGKLVNHTHDRLGRRHNLLIMAYYV